MLLPDRIHLYELRLIVGYTIYKQRLNVSCIYILILMNNDIEFSKCNDFLFKNTLNDFNL